jgi:mannan endo-1,4-beta-mannosidase
MTVAPRISLLLILLLLFGCASQFQRPQMPQAVPPRQQVLNFIAQRENNESTKRLISGQMMDSFDTVAELLKQTGYRAGIMGYDYKHYTPSNSVNPDFINHWNNGGFVTILDHFSNPATGAGVFDRNIDFADIITPGNKTYTTWYGYLDTVAAGLQALRDAGVVVLWRPFHEMNGGWFWWGARNTADFKTAWIQMYNYFTTTKGLNNLLWVYSPNISSGPDESIYYPGDQYVDIVSLDMYVDSVDSTYVAQYNRLTSTAPTKPFALAEFGPSSCTVPPHTGSYDYLNFLNGVKTYFPKTAYFMAWNGTGRIAANQNAQVLMSDSWIVNASDITLAQKIVASNDSPPNSQ